MAKSQTPQDLFIKRSEDGIQPAVAGITQISLATKDILYDPGRQAIYASVPGNAAGHANTVVTINPLNGQVGTSLTTGDNPGRLALSRDGRYLHVGLDGSSSIRRLDLQSQTPSTEFALGSGHFGSPLHAEEIEVLPGQPQSIAVALQDAGFNHDGVAIYDSGIQRPNKTPMSPQNDVIEFGADASTLFGYNTTNTEFGFHRLAVDANGVSLVSTLRNVLKSEADMQFDNGLIYGSNGAVIDPQASVLVGSFHLPGAGSAVAPDSANNRVYFISGADSDFFPKLWAFDLQTFLPIGNVSIPGLSGRPNELIRCGAAGLALRTSDNQVFLIQLSAIQPISATPLPSPTVGQDSVIKLQLTTNDLAFDPGTQKVYASIPGNVAGIGNKVAPINPATGNVGQPVFVGADPTRLAVSRNNQYLYVGLDGAAGVRQFDLQSQSAGLQFPLGFSDFSGPLFVNDMEVQPGNPSVVAISRKNKGFFPNFEGVAIYDNGVRRPNATQSHTGSNAIEFGGSPSVLYGLDTASTMSAFEKLGVDGSGVTVLSSVRNFITEGGDFKFDNGLIYASNGQVGDPESATLLGSFPISGLVAPDSSAGRVYFLTWSPASPAVTIYAFDSQTFVPVGFLTISNVLGIPGSFIRWGMDGLAFRTTGSQVFFLHTSSLHAFPTITPTFTTRSDGIREFSLLANDIVYNPSDQLIYASVPSAAGSIGNSIAAINPASGLVGQPVFIGSDPYKIAISDTGNVLYTSLAGIPRVRKLDLITKIPGILFGLGSDFFGGPFYGENLAVAPGNPDVVAVSTYLPTLLGGFGISLANNGVVLPNRANGNSMAFSGPYLYTYSNDSSEFGLRKLALTSEGFSQVDFTTNLVNGFGHRITAANGRIYGSDGAVAHADFLTLAGKFFRTDPGVWVAPDPANNRVYFLGLHEFIGTSIKITAYDASSFIQVGSLTVQNVISSDVVVRSFIRYGADGLAFNTTDGKIHFLTTSMITPLNPTPVPTPIQITPEIKKLSISTGDLVYNGNDGMIYASLPSRADGFGPTISFGNSIVPINPITGTLGQPVQAGSEPKKLAVTGNGQYVYAALDGAGAVCRLDVPSKTIGASFSLGNAQPYKGPRYVENMQVAPGSTGTLAISRMHKNGSPRHLGVAIYDNGTQRPVTTESAFPTYTDNNNVIEYSNSPSTIYGYNLENSTGDFHKLTVTNSGVQIASKVQNLFWATDIKFDNGLVYSNNGEVVDPNTGTLIGTYTGLGFGSHLVIPESASGIVFFLVDNLNGTATIRAYNQSSFALVGTLNIPGIDGNIASFIRWGTNGFAFRTTSTLPGDGNQVFIIQPAPSFTPPPIQFSSASYVVSEGSPRVDIVLTRFGDTTNPASVTFATSDAAGLTNCNVFNGTASPRCDYIKTLGTVSFAAGQTSKSFSVAIVDDSYAEGSETFTLGLHSPTGATLGAQSTTTVTITDNETTHGPNPIDNTNFFVRQQYIDFLGREPDPPGFAGWVNSINNCTGDTTQCDRIHVSQLFFQSAEFQQRGYFVYRFYPVAFGRKPDYEEFVLALASVSGFLDDNQLEAARIAFIATFMAQPAFANTYNPLNNTQFVDMLLTTAGVTLSNRQSMIDGLNNLTLTRAQVLRHIVESAGVSTKYNHQAYAVMEYFGYLRRQPDALYLDWIAVLDQTNNPRGMVTGFVNSAEYRQRFGP